MEPAVQQDEPPSSTGGIGGALTGLNNANANGSIGQSKKYDHDRDKADLIPSTLWNSVAGKISTKTGTINTPDGKAILRRLEVFR